MAGEESGIAFLIYIGGTLIGGQRNGTFKRTNNVIDASHKTSGRYKTELPGPKEWGLSGDGVIIESDAGKALLDEAFDDDTPVTAVWQRPDGIYYTGTATVADLSESAPYDGAATFAIDLRGRGAVTKVTGTVTGYPP